MKFPKIRQVRAGVLRGAGADYHDQGSGHWIDDHIASPGRLEFLGLASENCIRVCPDGPDELIELKGILEARIAAWACPEKIVDAV